MLKRIVSEVMLTLLLLSMLTLAFNIQPAKAATITVPDDYPSIQEAINAASPGDTIYVRSGIYYENVVVNKTVSLVGENKTETIIDGNETQAAVRITANNTNINGFTIQHGGYERLDGYFLAGVGMLLMSVCNNSVHDNLIINNTYNGVFLFRSCNNSIYENLMQNHVHQTEAITLYWNCRNNTVSNNKIVENLVAVSLYDSYDNSIIENMIMGNSYSVELSYSSTNMIVDNSILQSESTGILIDNSDDNLIDGNSIETCGYIGIKISHSSRNRVKENTLIKADIMLDNSDNNSITGNMVLDNDGDALWLGGSKSNVISANTVMNNTFGIWIQDSSQTGSNNNMVYHNNFINNTKEVISTSWYGFLNVNIWDDGYPSGGNYWSDYNGTDLYSGPYQNETGSDGIGDTSYVIDENNVDHYPLMNPYTITPPKPPAITATVDIAPKSLNLKSKGRWITCYIELPEDYNVSDIDVSTVMLNGTIPVDPAAPIQIGDYDNDSIPDLMVTFNRTTLVDYIVSKGVSHGNVTLSLSGNLRDRWKTRFIGYCIMAASALDGDVNCDGVVDIYDVVEACLSYGSKEGEPNWNPNANYAPPYDRIDIYDMVTIAYHYGETYP